MLLWKKKKKPTNGFLAREKYDEKENKIWMIC